MLAKTRAELASEAEKRAKEKAIAQQREMEMKRRATEQQVQHTIALLKKNKDMNLK